MSYEIKVREVWYKSDLGPNFGPSNRWDWEVYDEDFQLIDQGSAKYAAGDARKAAEKAATLHYRQQKAKVETYEYTPD